MLNLKSTLRLGTLVIAVLLVSTMAVEAAGKKGNSANARDACKEQMRQLYNHALEECEEPGEERGWDEAELSVCYGSALAGYHNAIEFCDDPALVGHASALSGLGKFDGKGTDQVVAGTFPNDLRGADTSGGHGSVDVGPSGGGSGGGSGKPGGNTANGLGHFSSANGGTSGGGTIY